MEEGVLQHNYSDYLEQGPQSVYKNKMRHANFNIITNNPNIISINIKPIISYLSDYIK